MIFVKTPFDEVIDNIVTKHYHNHRHETHSDLVSLGIFRDLMLKCPELRHDIDDYTVKHWLNVRSPTKRGRKMDLLIGEPDAAGNPDLKNVRICIENKSVITGHRNCYARFDDLYEVLQDLHGIKSEIIMVATILVGTAERVLNVPDGVKSHFKKRPTEFEETVVPRLSSGDQKLWDDFPEDISENRANEPMKTINKFQTLPTRKIGLTHVRGYDYILYVPIFIDNVNPPYLARENSLDIDIDAEYQKMLEKICSAYRTRWHL